MRVCMYIYIYHIYIYHICIYISYISYIYIHCMFIWCAPTIPRSWFEPLTDFVRLPHQGGLWKSWSVVEALGWSLLGRELQNGETKGLWDCSVFGTGHNSAFGKYHDRGHPITTGGWRRWNLIPRLLEPGGAANESLRVQISEQRRWQLGTCNVGETSWIPVNPIIFFHRLIPVEWVLHSEKTE